MTLFGTSTLMLSAVKSVAAIMLSSLTVPLIVPTVT